MTLIRMQSFANLVDFTLILDLKVERHERLGSPTHVTVKNYDDVGITAL